MIQSPSILSQGLLMGSAFISPVVAGQKAVEVFPKLSFTMNLVRTMTGVKPVFCLSKGVFPHCRVQGELGVTNY